MRRHLGPFALAAVALTLWALPARASYHTFFFDEVYSNLSGTVQFIELHESSGANNQNFVSLAPDIRETANSHVFTFSSNLPSTATANEFILIGTPGFAAIPGAPTPDYTIPSNFFNPAGDTLQYGSTGPDGVVDLTTFGPVSTDIRFSLLRTGTTGNVWNSGINSPTDFAGIAGSVPEPASGVLILLGSVALLHTRRRRSAHA